MLSEPELLELLKSSESHWLERKPSGVNSGEIRETLVAFANSISDGQRGVLFIGVSNDGKPQGVENADKMQKTVARIAEHECFPPVKCNPTAIRVVGVDVVAVVVEASNNRPHFSGHAFIRVGSETKKASEEMFEELVASRTDKVRRLLRDKGKVVTVVWPFDKALQVGGTIRFRTFGLQQAEVACEITVCDNFVLHLKRKDNGKALSVLVDKVTVSYDDWNKRTELLIN